LVDAGYNLIILAFFVDEVSWDCTVAWGEMTPAEQIGTIDYAHSKGARIIASAGGSTDTPYTEVTGLGYGQSVAQWVVNNNLDGMDFDLENFGMDFVYGSLTTAQVVQWVCDATNGARTILGDSRIITHAPQPPYFGAQFGWDNGYGQVYALCPTIDFFLVQFYNNGPTTTYETIFVANDNGASVTQMIASGIPMEKIVIGKPVHTDDIGDDTQGYNTAAELNSIFAEAYSSIGWNTGVMGWQWTDVASNTEWINTIYP
jgi:chitinase